MQNNVKHHWTCQNQSDVSLKRVWTLTKSIEKETAVLARVDETGPNEWQIFMKNEDKYRRTRYSTCWQAMEIVHLMLGIE